jgi:hypothetical protein
MMGAARTRMRTRMASISVLSGALLAWESVGGERANVAHAEGPPAAMLADADLGDGLRLEIRSDGAQVTASLVESARAPTVKVPQGPTPAVTKVAAAHATAAQVEVFELTAAGARGAWARIEATPPVSVVVSAAKGRGAVVWAGPTGWRGESPRRERSVVSTEDRTGDGLRDIVIATEREAAALCDGTTPWHSAVAWDVSLGKLRPVSIAPRVPERATRVTAAAAVPSPPPSSPPAARTFVEWTASTGGDLNALTDDNPRTVWNPGGDPSDVGAFLLGRAASDLIHVRGFEFDAAAIPGAWTVPERLLLRFSGGKSVVVDVNVPADARAQILSVPLPEPVSTRCLSIEVLSVPRTAAPGAHVGFSAVRVLTELDSSAGIAAALARITAAPTTAEGAAALRYVAQSVAGSPQGADILAAWSQTEPADEARLAVARALAPARGGAATGESRISSALVGLALGDAWARASSFEEQWRAVALLGAVARTDAQATWLKALATKNEHWMLRLAALRLLAEDGGAAQAPQLARRAARDASPRVRAWAAEHDALPAADRVALASKDNWAFVRAAATLRLPDGTALRSRASDPSSRVRVAAFERAGDLGTASLSGAAGASLRSTRESESVVAAAMRYSERTCRGELAAALVPWARGLARPSSGSRVELALTAIHALANLGTDEGKATLSALAGAGADPAIAQAARRGLESAPLCK